MLECERLMWMCVSLADHYMPFILNDHTQFFLKYFSVHFWYCCGSLLHELHYQHPFHVPENICCQVSDGRTFFVWTRLMCLVIVCVSTALTAVWCEHSQMKSRFYHLLLIQCDWEIHDHLCGIPLKGSKAKSFSEFYVCHWTLLEPILHKTMPSKVVMNS